MKGQKKQKIKQRHNKANGIDIPHQSSSGGSNTNSLWDRLFNRDTINEAHKVQERMKEYLIRHPKKKQ
jgi:predicted glycosyl hydrolase (DUF1957 family)